MPQDDDDQNTLDEQARKLAKLLLGEDVANDALKQRPVRKETHAPKAHWSTMGAPYSRPDANEPEHPILVECDAWRRAMQEHNEVAAQVAAARLINLLEPIRQRPTIANVLAALRRASVLDDANLKPLATLIAFVKQSQ